jgi:hypothetical protein
VDTWLDPQRTRYGFGYGSPWSLAGLVHPSGGDHPSSHCHRRRHPPCRALLNTVHNIRRGGRLHLQVLAPDPWVVGAPRGRTTAASWWRLRQSESVLA